MGDKYILAGKTPVEEPNVLKWGAWFEKSDSERIVSKTELPDGVRVSTIFLGLDHQYGTGPKQLFETVVFSGKFADLCERYATWDEAEAGHNSVVKMVQECKDA